MTKRPKLFDQIFITCAILTFGLISGCQAESFGSSQSEQIALKDLPHGMTEDEAVTLGSLEQIDTYPLYRMVFSADYDTRAAESVFDYTRNIQEPAWGCSLFAVFGNPDEMLFGRNFDWDISPGLLLYTDPPGGYASVSMVDIDYLGFGEERAFGLPDLPLAELSELLQAPYWPFDGMNETGLAVGMASVPPGNMVEDPTKATTDSLMVIRKILDGAATTEQAVEIMMSYNIDMGGGPPLHYLIADKTGQSALVEFSEGEVKVVWNSDPWHVATNFLVSETGLNPEGLCWRYGLISRNLANKGGELNSKQAMGLLEEVAQGSTQWSVVYGMSSGEMHIVMGREYNQVHTLEIEP